MFKFLQYNCYNSQFPARELVDYVRIISINKTLKMGCIQRNTAHFSICDLCNTECVFSGAGYSPKAPLQQVPTLY